MGTYLTRFERGGNPKFQNSWTYLDSIDIPAGLNLKYKPFYAKLYLLWPLVKHSNTMNVSRINAPHEMVELGVEYCKFTFGLFRRKIDSDVMQQDIYLQGLVIGYKLLMGIKRGWIVAKYQVALFC